MSDKNLLAVCDSCSKPISNYGSLVSTDGIGGFHQKAWTFDRISAAKLGEPVDIRLSTGKYRIVDVNCPECANGLGWKYDKSYFDEAKSKEGLYVLHGLSFVNKKPFRPRL